MSLKDVETAESLLAGMTFTYPEQRSAMQSAITEALVKQRLDIYVNVASRIKASLAVGDAPRDVLIYLAEYLFQESLNEVRK